MSIFFNEFSGYYRRWHNGAKRGDPKRRWDLVLTSYNLTDSRLREIWSRKRTLPLWHGVLFRPVLHIRECRLPDDEIAHDGSTVFQGD